MLDLSSLNKAQKQAVETLDGPLLIIAGPGTGKTTILTYRIAHILETTDTKPESILAMTFTEAGVFAMREKLYNLIGADAYSVMITTIHGFCNAAIQDYPEYFSQIYGFSPITDLERIKFAQEILDKSTYENLSPVNARDFYVPHVISAISTMKRENISPERFNEAIKEEVKALDDITKFVTRGPHKGKKIRQEYAAQEKRIIKYKELLNFYKEYQKILVEKKRYDYEDMILEVLKVFKKDDSELKSILQEKYQYLLIDEYQDTNDAQNELIFSLSEFWGNEANIFTVGDDDQAIYRFQGASVKNIEDFLGRYANATIITLKDNYRSQQTILDLSRNFIRHNQQSLEKTLKTVDKTLLSHTKAKPARVKLAHFHRGEAENLYIADTISDLKKNNKEFEYQNVAILVRNNADMDSIVDVLQRKRIPYVRKAGDNVLENQYIKQLLNLVRIVVTIGTQDSNDLLLLKILHYQYMDISKLDLLRLGRAYRSHRIKTLWDFIAGETKGLDLGLLEISTSGKERIVSIFDNIATWYDLSLREPLVKVLEVLLHDTGLLDHIMKDSQKVKHLNAFNSFFAEVKALNVSNPDMSLEEFLEAIELMNSFNIPIKEKNLGITEKGVQIMTAHSSKGLEFEYVFIPQFYTGKWDNKRKFSILSLPDSLTNSDDDENKLEEDRRLFYVALTRAKRQVYILYSDKYVTDWGNDRSVQPSQFLAELPSEMIDKIDTDKYVELVQEHIGDLLACTPYNSIYINTVEERDVIRALLSRIVLHPTGFNNYLECPMRFLLNNVLRIPSAISAPLAYGNAYHEVLERYYQSVKIDLVPLSVGEMQDIFSHKLEEYPLKHSQVERLISKGNEHIKLYHEYFADEKVKVLKTEYSLRGVLSGAEIKGKVDRIDYLDEEKKWLKIIDYKTGSPLSASAFDKLRPSAEFDKKNYQKAKAQRYYNQLMFYKVVADMDSWVMSSVAEVKQGSLLFVDPVRGQFVESILNYEKDAVEEMKSLIIDVWNKIQKLEFPREHTEEDGCSYCELGRNFEY